MRHGFLKTAAITPRLRVADPEFNTDRIIEGYDQAVAEGAKVIVFPELAITGYTCGDLFLQETLLEKAFSSLFRLVEHTKGVDALTFVGLPFSYRGKLYNVAAAISNGKLLGLIPKQYIPNYAEFYECRHFTSGPVEPFQVTIGNEQVPLGSRILFAIDAIPGAYVGCELCEDMWVPDAPDIALAMEGATLIVNLSASNETVGKDGYRRSLVQNVSARTISGYLYVSSGDGESTQDIVFGGHALIAENGTLLAENHCFDFKEQFGDTKILYGDIDFHRLLTERRRMNTFAVTPSSSLLIPVHMDRQETKLSRSFDPHPFVPSDKNRREERCEQILHIQSRGLAKRYATTGIQHAIIGVSGGLDSTLALLVTARAFDLLGLDRANILSVTMPCFGTTDRTYHNACVLAKTLGTTLREVNIKEAVNLHFRDIGQDPENHDVTYENGQARERTQILMDLANQCGGLVIGTGDMSELALGWATYNGDHMSMYGVNIGVPKTLVRHLVQFYADAYATGELQTALLDVLDTPVSPELLPPTEDGKISQKTEDLVGPYELHDFFLYYMLRAGFEPSKVYRVAKEAFKDQYDTDTIIKWEKTFYRRFFSQQFKRSCIPDGPKVGSVALSPRGDLRMPSDASSALWLKQIDELA